ncbi:MAG TPA: alpha/beta fold hydrolase [Chloroflexota bacterium]|nr:alpha/beta fold hydrolase [Chloroflexota bacterium]
MEQPLEPRVRYAQTLDGVNIAFASVGSGPPLVLLPMVPFGFFQFEWQIPEYRAVFEGLARHVELVQYDARGSGLSERTATDFSMAGMLGDLDAVVRRANLEQFALFGLFNGAPIALAYAAAHPERVTRLVLWAAFARGQLGQSDPQTQALLSLIERDWSLFTETAASFWMGWLPAEAARRVARGFRAAVSPETARAMLDAAMRTDVSHLLAAISAPTLVLHRSIMPLDLAGPQELVAHLPDAQLSVLEGESASPYIGDSSGVVRAVVQFCLGDAEPVVAADTPVMEDGLTPREVEVLRHVAGGDANQEIAARLGLSVHTVERHVANIYHKIDARGRADATAYALRHHLV